VRAAQIEVVGPDGEDDAEPEHRPRFNEAEYPINEGRAQTLGYLLKEFLELVDNQQCLGRLGWQVALQGICGLVLTGRSVPRVRPSLSEKVQASRLPSSPLCAECRRGPSRGATSLHPSLSQSLPTAAAASRHWCGRVDTEVPRCLCRSRAARTDRPHLAPGRKRGSRSDFHQSQ